MNARERERRRPPSSESTSKHRAKRHALADADGRTVINLVESEEDEVEENAAAPSPSAPKYITIDEEPESAEERAKRVWAEDAKMRQERGEVWCNLKARHIPALQGDVHVFRGEAALIMHVKDAFGDRGRLILSCLGHTKADFSVRKRCPGVTQDMWASPTCCADQGKPAEFKRWKHLRANVYAAFGFNREDGDGGGCTGGTGPAGGGRPSSTWLR